MQLKLAATNLARHRLSFFTKSAAFNFQSFIFITKRMVTGEQIKTTEGKTPISAYESNIFLDYNKYEQNLKIVKER